MRVALCAVKFSLSEPACTAGRTRTGMSPVLAPKHLPVLRLPHGAGLLGAPTKPCSVEYVAPVAVAAEAPSLLHPPVVRHPVRARAGRVAAAPSAAEPAVKAPAAEAPVVAPATAATSLSMAPAAAPFARKRRAFEMSVRAALHMSVTVCRYRVYFLSLECGPVAGRPEPGISSATETPSAHDGRQAHPGVRSVR
jgi:hypothetical protein